MLKRALEVQEAMIGKNKSAPKLNKNSRVRSKLSSKFISSSNQTHSIHNFRLNYFYKGFDSLCMIMIICEQTFKDIAEIMIAQMDYLRRQESQRSIKTAVEEAEVATTITHQGEDNYQLQEIMREKDQIIDMLQKEKNYYIRRCEQISKLN